MVPPQVFTQGEQRLPALSQEIFPHAFQNHSLACVVLTFTVVAPDVVLTFT